MDRTRLLTSPLDSLTLSDRATALLDARNLGRSSAEAAATSDELEDAPISLYLSCVVAPAAEDGAASTDDVAAWQRAFDSGHALRDPRVQAFFFGWHERATEILAEIAGAAEGDASEFRARWFLGSIGAEPDRDVDR